MGAEGIERAVFFSCEYGSARRVWCFTGLEYWNEWLQIIGRALALDRGLDEVHLSGGSGSL